MLGMSKKEIAAQAKASAARLRLAGALEEFARTGSGKLATAMLVTCAVQALSCAAVIRAYDASLKK